MVDEQMLTDAAWEPLIEEVRSRGKTPPKELRRRKKGANSAGRDEREARRLRRQSPVPLESTTTTIVSRTSGAASRRARAVATRYEKMVRPFLAVFDLAATADWLKF